ncbi:Mor transcription activator family protein [Weissella viridescens]|uniref:Mor transcription activator family protein n=1 Tax=Weissella viridescens TaxID=1629 RepID=UPI003AF2D028
MRRLEIAGMTKDGLEVDALHPTYREIYKVLGENSDALMQIFDEMSGQQVNLPVHLYEPDRVKEQLVKRVKQGEAINVNEAANHYGYSRRWIRKIINDVSRKKEG